MQFYMISFSFFPVLILLSIIEENAFGGGVLARFYRPGGGGFKLFLPGSGELPIKKLPGFCLGGIVRLGTD